MRKKYKNANNNLDIINSFTQIISVLLEGRTFNRSLQNFKVAY